MNTTLSNTPLLTVLMPVHNAAAYLRESIESILNQTLQDFQFVIFDDGSTDESPGIIESYANKDHRINALYLRENKGYVWCLNAGLETITSKYVARFDSDDISLPSRLEQQVSVLEANPHIGVVGSWASNIDKAGKFLNLNIVKSTSGSLRWQCFFQSPMIHPSVTFRTDLIRQIGLYNQNRMPAEDYDLWSRALEVCDLYNISEPLIQYRVHEASVSRQKARLQLQMATEVLQNHWQQELGIALTQAEATFLKKFHLNNELSDHSLCESIFNHLSVLHTYIKRRECKTLLSEVRHEHFKIQLYVATISRKQSYLLCLWLFLLLSVRFPVNMATFIIRKLFRPR